MQQQGFQAPDGTQRLDTRRELSARGDIERNNPDETPMSEGVELVRKFKKRSEDSQLRQKALRWWRQCDRYLDGDQWDLDDSIVKQMSPWQAKLTINMLHKVRKKLVSLLMQSIPKIEFLPRDESNTIIAEALDGLFQHEWERNGWTTTIGVALKQMVAHGIGWIKVYWDFHGDGGRGVAELEPVSNYDLFLDDGAVIRDGKLHCKWAIHRFEMTREKILSTYERDVGGSLKSDAEMLQEIEQRDTEGRPLSRVMRYIRDNAEIGTSTRGSTGAAGGDLTQRHPDHAIREDVYTVNECIYFDDSRVEGPEADEAEGEIPPLMYPNGRIITECNGTQLYDGPNKLGFNMYVPFCMDPDVERIYNPSVIYHCISPQNELNKRRSQIADHAAMTGNPVLVISQSANIDENFKPYPGAVVTTMDEESPTGGVRWLEAPPLSPEVVQSASASEGDIDKISGIEEIMWGRDTQQLESGSAVGQVQAAAESIPQMHTLFVDDSLKVLARNIASLLMDFTDEPRKYRVLDTRALEVKYAEFDPEALVLPSREQAVEMALQEIEIFQQQLMDAAEQYSPEDYEIIESYIISEIERINEEIEQIWSLSASDLISFDVRPQIGTRELTKQMVHAQAAQGLEIGAITIPTYLEMTDFPNWWQAWQLKMQESEAQALAEAEAVEEEREIQRDIDEDEHEQDIEIEREKRKTQVAVAQIRATAQRAAATQRAKDSTKKSSSKSKK